MLISLIAASSTNRVIGINNNLPWHLPKDLKYFKEKTLGHHMIMGRKTWESFGGKALPGRTSIVLTNSPIQVPEGVFVFTTLEKALQFARENGEKEAMVIGGGFVFEEALPIADRIYLTHVYTKIKDGNVFFPPVKQTEWNIIHSERSPKDEKNIFEMEFMILERKPD
jgi:dihydrofolate reductase